LILDHCRNPGGSIGQSADQSWNHDSTALTAERGALSADADIDISDMPGDKLVPYGSSWSMGVRLLVPWHQ
jgi:hypothetical protein